MHLRVNPLFNKPLIVFHPPSPLLPMFSQLWSLGNLHDATSAPDKYSFDLDNTDPCSIAGFCPTHKRPIRSRQMMCIRVVIIMINCDELRSKRVPNNLYESLARENTSKVGPFKLTR